MSACTVCEIEDDPAMDECDQCERSICDNCAVAVGGDYWAGIEAQHLCRKCAKCEEDE